MANPMQAAAPPLSPDVVRGLCGDILDWKVAAIVASRGTVADLETALAFASGGDDVMGEERRTLSGAAAVIYDLIVAEDELADER